jgi:hypothetical protein
MSYPFRNRIKGHRRVRAGDLVPHEFNYRLHGVIQREALEVLYKEVGFARSLLAYELPDGRLKLIDGHLRRTLDPEMEVEVEILDVDDDEARMLLLSIDPLAALAEQQEQLRDRLLELVPNQAPELLHAWDLAADKLREDEQPKKPLKGDSLPEQFYILITCRNERQQVGLLGRFKGEGLECKAVLG